MKRLFAGLLVAAACRTAPEVTPPDATAASPGAPAKADPDRPTPTEEPLHPFDVDILAVRGHAPLPAAPRLDVWLGKDAIGATLPGGEVAEVRDELFDAEPIVGAKPNLIAALGRVFAAHDNKGTVVLWADQAVTTETVVLAMHVATRAQFREFTFVVGQPNAREIIGLSPPDYASEHAELTGPPWGDLALTWTDDGVRAGAFARYASTGPQPPMPTVPLLVTAESCVFPGGARPDPAAIQATLDELCGAAQGKAFAIRIRPSRTATAGSMLWALAADQRPRACRLPAVMEVMSGPMESSCEGAARPSAALASFPAVPPDDMVAMLEALAQAMNNPRVNEQGSGTGSGYGRGSGAGFGGRGKRVPRVRMAKGTVTGALDGDIIRRIIRAHINEVRHCYNQGLVRDEELDGRVAVQFSIEPGGKVTTSNVATSSLSDDAVAVCIATAIKRWKFPKPADGKSVDVTQPFVLSPG